MSGTTRSPGGHDSCPSGVERGDGFRITPLPLSHPCIVADAYLSFVHSQLMRYEDRSEAAACLDGIRSELMHSIAKGQTRLEVGQLALQGLVQFTRAVGGRS